MRRRARGWRNAGCYVWRTRKPHAPFGMPIFGRHFAYAGQSNSRHHRDQQHRFGDPARGILPASWSDLDAKVYPLPMLFPSWKWARLQQERLWIGLLCPVYNVLEQPSWNLRRISRAEAARQRAARDRRRRSPGTQTLVDFLVTSVRIGLLVALLVGLALIYVKAR